MRSSFLICLVAVCSITAAVYFGGHALFPVPDTSEQLRQLTREKANLLDANSLNPDASDDRPEEKSSAQDGTDALPEKIDSAEQLRDAFAKFHHEFDAAQFSKAFQWISLVAKHQPENANFQLRKADVAFFIGRFQDSVSAYDAAIALDKELEADLWQRGLALYYAKKYKAGVEQFQLHQTVKFTGRRKCRLALPMQCSRQ